MAWQTLMVTKPAKLAIKHSNILLTQKDQEAVSLAISEIAVIVIDTPEVLLTSVFLQQCAKAGIVLVICDKRHLPTGIYCAFSQHSRTTKHTLMQVGWGQVFKNHLWQAIIRSKINNQAILLKKHKLKNRLSGLVRTVQSGDKTNRESYAASLYWKALLGDNFYRNDSNNKFNMALNYGYALLRSALARSITAHGFVPALGIFHQSELNAFNLADDLIEPFRPVVDDWVYQHQHIIKQNELTPAVKIELVQILNSVVLYAGKQTTLLSALTTCVASLVTASISKNSNALQLPQLSE